MNNMLLEYKERKNHILGIYDKLAEFPFVQNELTKTIINNDINQMRQMLENEEFIISVCGVMKAGKSSFLNHLIFGDKEVLPVDSTPCTAKLTKITYGEKDSIRVHFYTQKEWDELKILKYNDDVDSEVKSYYDEFLKSSVEDAAQSGIYYNEFIQEDRMIKSFEGFDELDNYSSKSGLYAPFVSFIEIIADREILKGVTIVDTPGINDRNLLRAKVTLDWINKSNAIIMLMYANTPLSAVDYQFIDQNLAGIPSDKILLTLSKIDLIEGGVDEVKAYITDNIINDKGLKERGLLKDREVYSISTMASLINYKLESGISLTENDEFYRDNMLASIVEESGGFPELIDGINKFLMKDKAATILLNAEHKIKNIIDEQIVVVKQLIELEYSSKRALEKSHEEIELEIEKIKKFLDKLEVIKSDHASKLKDLNRRKTNKVGTYTVYNDIIEKYEKWYKEKSVSEIVYETSGFIYKELGKCIPNILNSILDESYKSAIDQINDITVETIKEETKDFMPANLANILVMPFDVYEILNKIRSEIEDNIVSEKMEDLKVRFLKILWVKKTETKLKCKNEVSDQLHIVDKRLHSELDEALTIYFDNAVNGLSENLSPYLLKLKDNLDKSRKEKDDIGFERINNNITRMNEKLKEIELLKANISELLER